MVGRIIPCSVRSLPNEYVVNLRIDLVALSTVCDPRSISESNQTFVPPITTFNLPVGIQLFDLAADIADHTLLRSSSLGIVILVWTQCDHANGSQHKEESCERNHYPDASLHFLGDQGSDVGCPRPPLQIAACGITAPGSSGMRAAGTSIMMGGLLVGDFIAGGAGVVQQMATVSRRCSARAFSRVPRLRRNWSMCGCAAGCGG